MAETKFVDIYNELKRRIVGKEYEKTMMLPTEERLAEEFAASRNTIRKAIIQLNEEGYVYSVKGRGVVILESLEQDLWTFSGNNFMGLQSLNNSVKIKKETIVRSFSELKITNKLAKQTPFKKGEIVYYIERIRLFDNKRMVTDYSYFKKAEVPELNLEIAQGSIYEYLRESDFRIAAAKRNFLVEPANETDSLTLDLNHFNCVGVMNNLVYNDMGNLFEYTESRFIPNEFVLGSYSVNKRL